VGGGTCLLVLTVVGSVPPPGAGEHGSGGWYRSHWVGPVGISPLASAARDMSTIDLYFQFKFKTSRLN
jgi:hypothetical protein